MGAQQSSRRDKKEIGRKSEKAAILQNQLKEKYGNLVLEGFSWVEQPAANIKNNYVELTLSGRDQLGQKVDHVKLEDLFKDEEERKSTRILIEGPTGYGKTAITAKLAFDWASNENYMGHFEYVLLLSLRHCKGELEEILSQAAGITTQEDRDYIRELVYSNSKNVLFLIDEFDEASPETTTAILPFIENETYSHITLVITAKPGTFTLKRMESEPDLTKVIDKRITIEGFSLPQQLEFLRKHKGAEISPEIVLTYIKKSEIVPLEFLASPLLIHIFVLFLNTPGSLTNPTYVYKFIFNIAFKRYFSKLGGPVSNTFDIFAVDEGEMFESVKLMTNFGQFALTALSEKKDQITHEELQQQDIDSRFMDLGFTKQGVISAVIAESVAYTPIHKSVLEFCAAYYLWITSVSSSGSNWGSQVTSFRPTKESAADSSLFPFLAGLMGDRSQMLFNTLAPYSIEYSSWFGSLGFSLLSTNLTAPLLTSLSLLLPVEWRTPAYFNDKKFCRSPHHVTLLLFGLNIGTTKQIRWCPSFSAAFPDNVEVDTFIVPIVTPLAPLDKSQINGIACRELRINFKYRSNPTNGDTQTLLALIRAIQYQHICFNFPMGCSLEWLQCIHSAAMNGLMRDTPIKLMKCYLSENLSDQLTLLSELIINEKLQGIDILVYPSLLSASGIGINVLTTLLQGSLDTNVSQEQIDMIIAFAAKSTQLKRFTFVKQLLHQDLTIDLTLLCDGGRKAWEWVQLEFVEVQCSTDTLNQPLQIQHLSLCSSSIAEPTSMTLFRHCQVRSLTCDGTLLIYTNQTWPIHELITELRVTLQKSAFHHGLFFFLPQEMQNLDTLALTMASPRTTGTTLHTPLENILLPTEQSLTLKGLEIWEIEVNTELALELVLEVIRCLEGRPVVPASDQEQDTDSAVSTKSLKVEYLMLHTQTTPDPSPSTKFVNPFKPPEETEQQQVTAFLSLASVLKRPLIEQTLPRLDIVCLEDLLYYMSRVQPSGVSSWAEAFPAEEGFNIEEEILGLNLDDNVQSRGIQDKLALSVFKKFSHYL